MSNDLMVGVSGDEVGETRCKKCKVVAVRTQKGRRHDRIDIYAPVGQVRYET